MSDILPGEQSLHVLGGDVDLEVHKVADTLVTERRDLGGVRDDGHREAVVGGVHDGEADPVDGDRALPHNAAEQVLGHPDEPAGGGLDDAADADAAERKSTRLNSSP